jgi:hypothetical protein
MKDCADGLSTRATSELVRRLITVSSIDDFLQLPAALLIAGLPPCRTAIATAVTVRLTGSSPMGYRDKKKPARDVCVSGRRRMFPVVAK